MTTTNRETIRDQLTSIFQTALVGTGKPAQVVYGYLKGDFGQQSPVVVVCSAGSEREKRTNSTRTRNYFYFHVITFTLYSQESSSWGEDDAADRTDLLEKTIYDTIESNKSNSYWADLSVDGKTEIDPVMISGEEYQREIILVKVLVFDN